MILDQIGKTNKPKDGNTKEEKPDSFSFVFKLFNEIKDPASFGVAPGDSGYFKGC